MFNQQKYWARIRGFVNRMKFRLANWLLKPFNLMIVSATDFHAVRYIQDQMAMYVERSGALPQRLKARTKLRQYLQTMEIAIASATALDPDPVVLEKMPPEVQALARILQEALEPRRIGPSPDGTILAGVDDLSGLQEEAITHAAELIRGARTVEADEVADPVV